MGGVPGPGVLAGAGDTAPRCGSGLLAWGERCPAASEGPLPSVRAGRCPGGQVREGRDAAGRGGVLSGAHSGDEFARIGRVQAPQGPRRDVGG